MVFNFDSDCHQAYEYLRKSRSSSQVLEIYNPQKETELHCDASALGFGAVVMQRQDDGKFHPIGYFSKSTTRRPSTTQEAKYDSSGLEALAILYDLQRLRVYIEGILIKIETDSNSLTMILNKRDINPRIARWALKLENYYYKIQHRSGTNMSHADALSICNVIAEVDFEDIDFQLKAMQNQDPMIMSLKDKLSNENNKLVEIREGYVFRKYWKITFAKNCFRCIIYSAHLDTTHVVRIADFDINI